ncbi:cytochrome c/c1 heme-lyase [Xylaria acuta]|nr:cytochrome c/c1 heme-lyase [Xylaria acuta]
MLHDIIDQIFLDHRRHDNASPPPPHTPPSSSTAMSADAQQPATCPVDHKSRAAWLEKAKAASSSPSDTALPSSHPPVDTRAKNADGCPVDHGAREVWMQQARAASEATANAPPNPTAPSTTSAPLSQTSPSSWSSYLPFFSSTTDDTSSRQPSPSPQSAVVAPDASRQLGIDREVSTIPRTSLTPSIPRSGGDHAAPPPPPPQQQQQQPPANNEQETGADGTTGNWIYPSERMFFEAMKRKGHDPRAADMRTVVPIHNAVNERAWAEIKAWEGPWIQGSSCDGPRLHSFSGLSTQMSPKARLNTFLGYQAPFDRHDWVVDRCGKEIEYVIDFYAGRNASNGADGKLSFYLDVRPKMNSWEGVKMRAFRAAGLA